MYEVTTFNYTFNTNKIDITDPCYDKDVWCRSKADIIPGDYTVVVVKISDKTWGDRVQSLSIVLSSKYDNDIAKITNKGDFIGEIGVDAGLAGFFSNKPDYTDAEWCSLCDNVFLNNDFGTTDCGVWSSSGYGDGSYDVFGLKDDSGRYYALSIVFI